MSKYCTVINSSMMLFGVTPSTSPAASTDGVSSELHRHTLTCCQHRIAHPPQHRRSMEATASSGMLQCRLRTLELIDTVSQAAQDGLALPGNALSLQDLGIRLSLCSLDA